MQALSGGRLSPGMTLAQVEKILGPPKTREPYSGAEATLDSPTLIYPDMKLMFRHGQLQRLITAVGASDDVSTGPPDKK